MVLAFMFSAASTISWKADADYDVIAVVPSGSSNALLSTDPTLTIANVTTPSANKIVSDILILTANTASKGMSAPVASGSTLFVVSAAQQTVFVYLEPSAVALS
jgi:hypothetical protein